MKVRIAPSLLSADFARLADALAMAEAGGADLVHVDVMDGHFVPSLTIGPPVVRALRKATRLPLDVHLMIEHPDHYVPRFVQAGASSITVHVEPEAKHNVAATLGQIRGSGCRVGLTLNPATRFELLEPYLDKIDMLLIMTVHPGFGGQAFRADQMAKVKRAADWNASHKGKIDIEVDGGINAETARVSVENGANVLVAGTSVFHAQDYAKAILELRGEAA